MAPDSYFVVCTRNDGDANKLDMEVYRNVRRKRKPLKSSIDIANRQELILVYDFTFKNIMEQDHEFKIREIALEAII